ncbi:MAG TPA: RtcB family protein [Gordonia sp. (in: high G+C Gram-positive bacteria)]|uniref:RtcB family protein n=1 Tax=unclassified Gordonia (in: high G+C Gram-positive bacteria) TaxID=2657482 RepID=UPI000FC308BE|nr:MULTISPECIES: RtcB family protein [unclassified Gordonia (in: high G+C Gram-positive bacteria)]RUP37744.1 MAG: RtcB family protein [Gordonia sp. (in: high G+C Gram-positive bacteria)]HNP55412.1 RtcB family protein [Gordonia sp. (in: high G+C Gram-positive bacteria)]HRC51634.1 RtcB family protein [Gordonia sp. (in: high G+C Gram-positive bacteria)]
MNAQFPVSLTGATAPTLLWAQETSIEAAALDQLRRVSRLPWVHGVAVCPAAVGVDIGCGMAAVKTDLVAADLPDDLSGMRSAIEAKVPVGRHGHDSPVNTARLHFGAGGGASGSWDPFWKRFTDLHRGVRQLDTRAQRQMGSLGGGNHFIEVCLDDEGAVWIMLHSGSRNIGKELADRHMAVAAKLPHNTDLPDRDLAVFVAGTPEMDAYRRDLEWAQEYAARNRAVMLALVCAAVRESFPGRQVRFDEPISCHHNYVAVEEIDGIELLVTRKGAIRAGTGDLGLIPGSMGTGSYVVRGLGSAESFYSASHGAGRRMSRSKARKTFTAADLVEQTAGVESRKDFGVVDEIPAAYKDIDEVIAAQTDLVEVVAHLRQVVCVKG